MTHARAVTALLVGIIVGSSPLAAQDNGNGFLFGTPHASFALRGGLVAPDAHGDLFDFVTDQFTIGRGNFRAPMLDADLSFRLAPRLDLALSAGYSRSVRGSEYRHWVDNNNLPIQQSTALARVPLTASLRWYLAPRGRSIGEFAWIPTRFAPYVGAGGGTMWYRFMQEGDFIDFNTTNVFSDRFTSSGWTKTATVMAGGEYTLNPRLGLAADARYHWAKAKLGQDFVGFDGIDLSGFALTLGFTVRL
ncbi:MAG: hypothetical protein HOQ26_16480 [Gemmatimonadaceae bacterium]|nr:hypothetical protein [Gemmatimonadaceae bacterium]NUQ94498.1 hypothetical protein [Gemmatimonadaceae bacterium]